MSMIKSVRHLRLFLQNEQGSVALIMAFVLPVILLMGGLVLAGTNYNSNAAQVRGAAQSVATLGGISPSSMAGLCSGFLARNPSLSSCTSATGTLFSDGSFCPNTASSCPTPSGATLISNNSTQATVCAALAKLPYKNINMGNACSTATVSGSLIAEVDSGKTGPDGMVPIALNECMFNNGGTQNSGTGRTFWDDDNIKPYSSYASATYPAGWGHGDSIAPSNGTTAWDSFIIQYFNGNKTTIAGTGGNYNCGGNDRCGQTYSYCANTANWIDLNQNGSSSSVTSTFFGTLISSTTNLTGPAQKYKTSDGKTDYYRSVKINSPSSDAGPGWLTSGSLQIGEYVPVYWGMAANATWYTNVGNSGTGIVAGKTYLFPVVKSFPGDNDWGQQSAMQVTAFTPMTVNAVCLGSLGAEYIDISGKGWTDSGMKTTASGCDYGSSPYTVTAGNNKAGKVSGTPFWPPYLSLSNVTGYKAVNARSGHYNNSDGKNYGATAGIIHNHYEEGRSN